jgi:hypothetical protein
MVLILVLVQSCATVPHTQRRALILVSPSQDAAMGEEAYREILSQQKLSQNKKWVLIVDKVERNLARHGAERMTQVLRKRCKRLPHRPLRSTKGAQTPPERENPSSNPTRRFRDVRAVAPRYGISGG